MPINPIYPVVSDLLPLEKIPSELEGLREALEGVLGQLYFKDFLVGQSYHGEAAFYSLTLVTFNPLGLSIPFVQDLKLVLNPDNQGNTEIPITFDYRWEVLKYINGFDFSSFDNSIKSIVTVLMQLAGVTKEDIVSELLGSFIGDFNALETFVTDFNQNQGTSLVIDNTLSASQQLTDVVNQIELGEVNLIEAIVKDYIEGASFSEGIENVNGILGRWYGNITTDSINEILKIKFNVLIPNLSLGLQFPRKWLVPVDNELEPLEEPNVSILSFNAGSLGYSSMEGFLFENTSSFSLTPSIIGNTGLILEVINLKVDLKEGSNIPEADAFGRGPGFKGLYAQTASITLPKRWFDNDENNPNTTARLAGYDILVGTGGFSGRLALEAIDGTSDPLLVKTIGSNGFEVGFSSFDINFDQNKIVSSSIAGRLKIPKLKDELGNDAEIDIKGHLDSDGDFLITASEQDGFAPIEIPNILKIYIQDVDLGSEDGNFFIGTTAEVEFTNPIMSKLLCAENGDPVRIALPNIRIYSNGNFEIVGGDIPLPTNFGLCLGPVNMSISNLNFTSTQREVNGVLREYKCWGFDGALNVDPLGVDVRGNGIKYCYTVDDDPDNGKPRDTFIRISTIEVDLIIPGDASPDSATAIINGYVSIPEPGVSTEYAGGVSLKLPKVGLSGNVDMRVDPKYPAFILDANIELPVAIPLANTGLGVFGFRGLLGFRYVAEKEAVGLTSGEDTWYDYLTYPERGINLPKFRGPAETANAKNAFSIGAGASIATLNNDTVINFRVFLLLSIPSLVLIEGKASILSENLGLDGAGEPPFYAFLAFGDSSIEAGLGADFRLPSDTGDILTLQAKVQAGFFFKNPSAWYINIGTKQEPITARVVSLITAQLYLQLSAKGIEAGARAEFDFDKTYGPVRVRAYAYVELGGYISFERPQLGGYFGVGGMAEIDIKILSLYIEIGLLLGAEASRPYLIYGEFRLCVKVKIFFIKIKFCGQVELKWEKSRTVDRTPIPPLPSAGQYQPSDLVKGAHMLTGDAFDIKQLKSDIVTEIWEPSPNNPVYNNTVIPLDTYIDFRFSKVLNPTAVANKTGSINNAPSNYIDLIPPQKTIRGREVRQVQHLYSIEDIEIKAWNGSTWIDYHPYEAIEVDDPSVTPSALKIGHWQKQGKEYNALRLLADSPFSFTQLGEPGWFIPEQSGLSPTSLFCQNELLLPQKANWLRKPLGATYLANTDEGLTNLENFFTTGRLAFWVKAPIFVDNLDTTYNATVVDQNNGFGFARSLEIFNFMSVELRVPNPSNEITLTLSTTAAGVTLSFYRSVINDTALKPQYELVDTVYKTRTELQVPVTYTNGSQAISRITVQPDFLNLEAINALNDQIELIRNQGYEAFLAGNAGETELVGASEAEELQKQIIDLLETGCAASVPGGVLTGGIGQMQIGTTFCVGMTASVLENLSEYTNCTTLLHEVSWLSQRDFQYNSSIPSQAAIDADFQLAEDSISKVIAPIWRPDTKYYIKVILRDTVDKDDGGNSANYYYYYGFKTVGPIGHFHNANGVTYGLNELTGETNRDGDGKLIAPDRFPLTNLGRYIDYQRSYPNADGNLLASKPLFYANEEAKLQLFFVRPQTYHMFNAWQAYQGLPEIVSEMKVIIKDPVNDTLIPYPLPVDFEDTTIPDGSEAWEEDVSSVVQTDPLETVGGPLVLGPLRLWNRLSRSSLACVSTGGDPIKPKTRKRTVTLTNLKPQKLYTALVNNVHKGVVTEVHNYGFKTSRYANFGEQINSFQLSDNEGNTQQAIFTIPITLSSAEIGATWEVISNPNATGNALEARFGSRFDQVFEGIWGLAPLPVAETMEFNAVVDQNTGDTIALWVRNPEPLNDPKIPVTDIGASLEVLNNANNNVDGNYKVLHSKDYAQALVMRNNKRITNTALRIRFDYLLWDGNRYAVEDSVLVEGLNVNS